jgi:KilA-N domain
MKKGKGTSIEVQGTSVSIISEKDTDYISLTDMLKANDGEFFISDWLRLRNRNTVEFMGIWESIYNPDFNYGEFATIRIEIRRVELRQDKRRGTGGEDRPDACQSGREPLKLCRRRFYAEARMRNVAGVPVGLAHESFLNAVVQRTADDHHVQIAFQP